MHIMVVGLNHQTAPVEVRERVSVAEHDLDDVLAELRATRTVLESVVLSTCNRTEIYAVVHSLRAGEDYLQTFFGKRMGDAHAVHPYLYMHSGKAAVVHLMRVACGLDSMVIGETQILGQVRNSYLVAADVGNTGALLNQLFRRAIQVGKRAQTETSIGQSPVSVSYAAVQLAKKIFGDLKGREVLLIGAGKMSRLAAQHLHAAGIAKLLVVNRTYATAVELANQFGGQPVAWDELASALRSADIVLSSTGARNCVLTHTAVERAVRERQPRPMVIIDIAVPRDVEPSVSTLRNVYLYDIDDLQGVVAANLVERRRQAEQVEKLIDDALEDYSQWLSEQEIVPLIAAIRAKGVDIQASVMDSLRRKLPQLSEREIELLHKHTMSIVNQLLREPIQNMKELGSSSGASQHVRVFAQLFGISDEELRRHATVFHDAYAPEADSEASGFADAVWRWSEQVRRDRSEPQTPLHPVLR